MPPPDPETFTPDHVPRTFCTVYEVLNSVCQQCHQAQPINGAPIPLMTFADTQAPFPNSTDTVIHQMQIVVHDRFMPYMGPAPDGGAIVPTVLPLTDKQWNDILNWIDQGATDLGGTDCPMVYDWAAGRIPPGR